MPRDPAPARKINTAASILAAGVLTDSTIEHYRAGFHNRAMFVAPIIAAGAVATTSRAAFRDDAPASLGKVVLGASVLTGLVGFGFHLLNISRRTGGWNSGNVFFGAPAAAPLALTMAGTLGLLASRAEARTNDADAELTSRTRVGTLLGALSAIGLLGTSAEAGLLHFRGAFQNPFMYAPVVVPPVAAVSMAVATATQTPSTQRLARTVLRLTTWLGVVGVGFHTWGVQRRMGGWRNWRQNLLAGPPLPAPPAFTGLALAGLAALDLAQSERVP